jgi:type IV pilus assembly protein PilB
LKSALEVSSRTGKKVGEVLTEQGAVTAETLATILSFQLNVPIVDLKQFNIQPEAIQLVPENVAREHGVLPLAIEGDTLTVAMLEPQDLQALDTLAAVTHKRIKPLIPLHGGISEGINSNYKLTSQIERQAAEASRVAAATARAVPEPLMTPEAIAQAPIVKAVEMLIHQAIKDRASDVHIEPQENEVRVRYRIDGILHPTVSLPIGVHAAMVSRIKVLAGMNIAERRRPQDGQFSMKVGAREVDFRVATIETHDGEMVVIRVLDKSVSVHRLPELGFQPAPLQVYERMLQSPFGMVLVSGPTGSGKTTTLYASVSEL